MPPIVDASTHPARRWTHSSLVQSRWPRQRARWIVSRQLVRHELAHLAGPAGVVAGTFAGDLALRGRSGVVLTLSRSHDRVRLEVESTTSHGPSRTDGGHCLLDLAPGQGSLGLLSLDWGVTDRPAGIHGLWALFDTEVATSPD